MHSEYFSPGNFKASLVAVFISIFEDMIIFCSKSPLFLLNDE